MSPFVETSAYFFDLKSSAPIPHTTSSKQFKYLIKKIRGHKLFIFWTWIEPVLHRGVRGGGRREMPRKKCAKKDSSPRKGQGLCFMDLVSGFSWLDLELWPRNRILLALITCKTIRRQVESTLVSKPCAAMWSLDIRVSLTKIDHNFSRMDIVNKIPRCSITIPEPRSRAQMLRLSSAVRRLGVQVERGGGPQSIVIEGSMTPSIMRLLVHCKRLKSLRVHGKIARACDMNSISHLNRVLAQNGRTLEHFGLRRPPKLSFGNVAGFNVSIFFELPSLRSLCIHNMPLDNSFDAMRLSSMFISLRSRKSLERLCLDGCDLSCKDNLAQSQVADLITLVTKGRPLLKELHVKKCCISEINFLQGCSFISVLDLSDNDLSQFRFNMLGRQFSHVRSLTWLCLDRCGLCAHALHVIVGGLAACRAPVACFSAAHNAESSTVQRRGGRTFCLFKTLLDVLKLLPKIEVWVFLL